jgi:hypothetical protein
MKREKVYRETIETLLEKKKMTKMGFCEQIGYTQSWFSKAFGKGYCDVAMPNIKLWAIVIGCTEEELTAIPVSPSGKKKADREAERPAEIVSTEQIGNLTATMIDGFAMLHQDLQILIETMHKYWRSEEPKYQVRDREQP